MENAKTQCQKIINFLKTNGQGTTLDFTRKLYIMSPRRRISDIRAKSAYTGLTIIGEKVCKKGVCFNVYRIAKVKRNRKNEKRNN